MILGGIKNMTKAEQSGLYGSMADDLNNINSLSNLGRSVMKEVGRICLKNKFDDTRLIKELKMYGINLEVMQK
jgi:hypothetical protein